LLLLRRSQKREGKCISACERRGDKMKERKKKESNERERENEKDKNREVRERCEK